LTLRSQLQGPKFKVLPLDSDRVVALQVEHRLRESGSAPRRGTMFQDIRTILTEEAMYLAVHDLRIERRRIVHSGA